MFEIGKTYRCSSRSKDTEPIVDGLPNFYYETFYEQAQKGIHFEKGIHNLAAVELGDGNTRIPAILISSSPHKARTDTTPWEDDFDPDHGHIRYYGDAKSNDPIASEWTGNALLLETFVKHCSPDMSERLRDGVPLIFFKRVEYDGRQKGNIMFQDTS